MRLPGRVFLTGVPGSRWSSICQQVEQIPGVNTSDRKPHREFVHHTATTHRGAYFGRGMELEAKLEAAHLDDAWSEPGGTRIVKSHDWAYVLPEVKERFPEDWIMLVYRPDLDAFAWWHEVGGFQIKYPNYAVYKDAAGMLGEIVQQNRRILEFAREQRATWHYFTADWIEHTFGFRIEPAHVWPDILVTVIK